MSRPFYTIELVGGPDDGAKFVTWNLPSSWKMTKIGSNLQLLAKSDTYWRSGEQTKEGHYVYVHEGYNKPCCASE